LALDDSFSMQEQSVGNMALKSLCILSLALSKMEAGMIAISGIKNGMQLLHSFEKNFIANDCEKLVNYFTFQH
jgi:midasin (ATPase involved in ribosome maturation)